MGIVGLRMTAEEYLALGETPERMELIEGVVVMPPSPTTRPWRMVRMILRQLEEFGDAGPGLEVFADTDVLVRPTLVYRPSICAYAPGRFAEFPERLRVAPDLVVEVLSPSNRALDLVTKRDDFGRFGVTDYWVVDPDNGQVRAWRRAEAGGGMVAVEVQGDLIEAEGLKGFVLDLLPIREFVRRIDREGRSS